MPARVSKVKRKPPPRDPNVAARRVIDLLTGGREPVPDHDAEAAARSLAASIIGKLGASKGGKARAAKLSKKRRKAIAKKAARQRWARNG